MECGSTTNNTERQKQVGFSNTIFIIGTRLMTKKDAGIKDFPELAGKNVVTTAGTTSERLLRKMNEDKKMGMNVTAAGPLRNGLIRKGIIYSPQHGDTAFTVPLFDEFMKRTMPELPRKKLKPRNSDGATRDSSSASISAGRRRSPRRSFSAR